jgi:hypothetical protein
MPRPQSFEQRFLALEREVERLKRRQPLANSGMRVTGPGELEVIGNLTITGDLTAEGKISNEALVSPVDAKSVYDYVTNFTLTTTPTNIKTRTVPVPAGFTRAAVSLTVRVYAINNSAGLDYILSQANINGYNGLALPVPATNNNGSAMNVSTFSTVLADEALGSALSLQIAAWTGFGTWAANASNSADLSASIAWYR